MTKSPESFDSVVMMSSVMPSEKYSCSGSALILSNGRTATRRGLGGCIDRRARRGLGRKAHAIDVDRVGDVLHALRPEVVAAHFELALNLIVDGARDAHPAGVGELLQPRRYVDAVAEDVALGLDDVAEVDADAKGHAAVRIERGVTPAKLGLNLDPAAHRLDRAREFGQHRIAGRTDHPAAAIDDPGVHRLAVRGQGFEGGLFVGAHEPAVAFDVGGQDDRDLALVPVRAHRRRRQSRRVRGGSQSPSSRPAGSPTTTTISFSGRIRRRAHAANVLGRDRVDIARASVHVIDARSSNWIATSDRAIAVLESSATDRRR